MTIEFREILEQLKAEVVACKQLSESAQALLQVVTIHYSNFERLTAELNADRIEWRSQIDRIWQHLQERGG